MRLIFAPRFLAVAALAAFGQLKSASERPRKREREAVPGTL